MSRKVMFNGALLVRPGAATKVDATAFNNVVLEGISTLALVGEADDGEPRVVKSWTSALAIRSYYRSGTLVDAAGIAKSPANDPRVPGGPTRFLTYKVNNSTQAYAMLTKAALATAAEHQFTEAGPYQVNAGDVFNYETDSSGGAQNITFAGTQAVRTGSSAMSFPGDTPSASDALVIRANDGGYQTVVFAGTESSLALVIAAINAVASGFYAQDGGSGELEFVSTQFGTGSKIEVVGSLSTAALLTKLKHSNGSTSGTGDAVNLAEMTAAELKTKFDATTHMVLDTTTSPPTLKSATVGASGQLIISASSPTALLLTLGATAGTYNGTASAGIANTIKLLHKRYGVLTNNAYAMLTEPSAGLRKITLGWSIDGVTTVESSPNLCGTPKLTVRYVGAGSACTMTLTETQLTTSVTGGPGGENLSLAFASYETLADLVDAINAAASGAYSATLLIANGASYSPSKLDWVTAVDVKTSTYSVYAKVSDIVDWVNDNSDIYTAIRQATGSEVPDVISGKLYATGGTLGTSDNSIWATNALVALSAYRAPQLVPLVSEDPSASVGTYTRASVFAAFAEHARVQSSTAGKNETQVWLGYKANKADLITEARTLNSEHVCLAAARPYVLAGRSQTLQYLPEWAAAVSYAAMRCGSVPGEPLTWKYLNWRGMETEWDQTEEGAIEELILAGVMLALPDAATGGYKIEKGITTYNKDENDAYIEEQLVQIWKSLSYDLRNAVERYIIGTRGTTARLSEVLSKIAQVFRLYGPEEFGGTDQLVDYSDLFVTLGADPDPADVLRFGGNATPVPGVNFALGTVVLLPARIAVTA